jgi:DeoR/GlpR family transcriptional regulator of sugar metabolism
MFTIERQDRILALLRERKAVTVVDLAQRFFTSESTIRRDLALLAEAGLVRRTFGGAIRVEGLDAEIPLSVRESENRRGKEAMAAAAAGMVRDDEVLFLDSSSSVLRMVPHLASRSGLVVITNGAKTAVELAEVGGLRVYCTGGRMREHSQSFVGAQARRFLQDFRADRAFFSVRALSAAHGAMDVSDDEAEIRQLMIQQAKESCLLCEHAKMGQDSFAAVCPVSALKAIVSDRPVATWPADLLEAARSVGVLALAPSGSAS